MEKSSNRRFGVRTVAAIVAGLMVGGMCTAMTASAADDSAAGYSATAPVNLTRPATVPSMDGWTDGTGAWTLGEGTRVVSSDALAARAQSLASELTKFTDVDINQWHLYVQDTPTAAHGRGLGVAKVYTQDGELVAAMAQEALIRVPQQ